MPAGSVIVKAVRRKGISQPGIDEIFQSFRTKKILEIQGKVLEERKWRPKGINSYKVEIFSIERTFSAGISTTIHDEHVAKGILIGMNGVKGNFPSNFSCPSKGPENAIEIRFNSKRKLEIEYHEYLSL